MNYICPRDNIKIRTKPCKFEDCYLFNKKAVLNCFKVHCDLVFNGNIPLNVFDVFYNKNIYNLGINNLRIIIANSKYDSHCKYCGREVCICYKDSNLRRKINKINKKWKKLFNNKNNEFRQSIKPYIKYNLSFYIFVFNKFFKLKEEKIAINLGISVSNYKELLKIFKYEYL